jgi:PPP family 3-phenylpropionic acid transporter
MSVTKGFSDKEISLILGILPLVSVFTFFIWGAVIDKYKKLLFVSKIVNIANIVTLFSLIWIDSFILFFVINFIRTILMQPAGVVNDEYLLNLSNKYGASFGKIRVFATVGYGIAGIICTVALKFMNPQKTIILASIFILLNLIALFFLPEITKPQDNIDKHTNLLSNIRELFKNKEFIIFMCTHGLLTAIIGSATGYGIPILLIKLNAPNFYIGMLPILMIVFEVLLLPYIEKLKIYEDFNLVLKIASGLLIVRWVITGATDSYMVIIAITILHGIINSFLLPLPNRILWNIIPKSNHSTAIVVSALCANTIFVAIINLITGYTADLFGVHSYGVTYLVLTAIVLLMLFKYKVLGKHRIVEG